MPNERKIKISYSHKAKAIVGEDEAKMIAKWIVTHVEEAPEHNSFTFKNLGLVAVHDGDEITILTKAEYDEILGKK